MADQFESTIPEPIKLQMIDGILHHLEEEREILENFDELNGRPITREARIFAAAPDYIPAEEDDWVPDIEDLFPEDIRL